MAEGKRVKLSERTADRLYEMIVEEKRYEPGSKLPNENELSNALRVSRTTLREAISFLVAQGVLEIRRGKGTFVADSLPAGTIDLTALAGVRSRGRAKDLFEMRLIFEPATAALALPAGYGRGAAADPEEGGADGADRPPRAETGRWRIRSFTGRSSRRPTTNICGRLYPIINSAVNEIMQLSQNRQHMQNVAISDNQQILYFLMQRDEAGARHAMSIHMRHLLHILQN